MENEELITVEAVEETCDPAPIEEKPKRVKKVVDKTTDYKKQIKTLTADLELAKAKNAELMSYVDNMKTRCDNLEKSMDGLIAEYTRITNYIKTLTSTYHQSLLMALKEDR